MRFYFTIILSILSFLFCSNIYCQNIKVSSTIIDAENGEPIPYVTVYVSGNKGAVSNLDGHFEITVNEDSKLKISYVGYETLTLDAVDVPSEIQMHQLPNEINEVIVLSDIGIMKDIENKLESDYMKSSKELALLFNRVTIVQEGKKDMVEDVIVANSANNLRSINVASGNYWCEKSDGKNPREKSSFRHTNLHELLTIGPLVKDAKFWRNFILPFSEKPEGKAYELLYDISHETIVDEENRYIYKLSFKKIDKNSSSYKSKSKNIKRAIRQYEDKPIMEGVMYVDADDFSLLRIDAVIKGVIFNVAREVGMGRIVTDMNIHADYNHSKGFTEVDNMSFSVNSDVFRLYSIVTNVSDNPSLDESDSLNLYSIKNNLLTAITEAGETKLYLKLRDVIKRTKEEEMFIENQTKE